MGSVLRLAPPLTLTEAEMDLGVQILDEALRTVWEGCSPGVPSGGINA
jgi:4-aminobutyrate aminotransferase-like enzyme